VLSIMALNIRGIRQSSIVVNVLTIGKLTPLVLFIVIGLPYVSFAALRPDVTVTWEQASTAALLLIFAFGGYEVIPVPAGEAKDPRRAVPFAMITTIIIVAVVMTLAQVVALGTLPALTTAEAPLASAAMLFMGAWGALLMTAGASISIAGNNVGAALSGSRSLFALAEQGDVPRVFGHIHPRFRTPDVAIVFTCLSTLALALTGSFVKLAAISAIALTAANSGSEVRGRINPLCCGGALSCTAFREQPRGSTAWDAVPHPGTKIEVKSHRNRRMIGAPLPPPAPPKRSGHRQGQARR